LLWYIQRYSIMYFKINMWFYTEFWHGLPLEISTTSYELQMLLQLTVACS
jgi:hypothetical protein